MILSNSMLEAEPYILKIFCFTVEVRISSVCKLAEFRLQF
jgi:hypothetical protein